jgi:hypothetical protein
VCLCSKRNQSAEDLICDHYHGGDFKIFACRDSLEGHRAKCLMSCRKKSRETENAHEAREGPEGARALPGGL